MRFFFFLFFAEFFVEVVPEFLLPFPFLSWFGWFFLGLFFFSW
jgi:hypothetical protein